MEFKTFDQFDPDESITALFYGPAGAGKTEAAGSAGERSLYIDVGKSAATFHGTGFKARKGSYKGIYVPVSEDLSKSFVPNKATAFDQVCNVIDEALQKIPEKFDTIIIDEMTRFRTFALYKGIEVNQFEGRSKTKEKASQFDVVIPGVQDFSAEMSLIEQFCNGYTDICKRQGKHLIVIAHERLTYKKGDKVGDLPTLHKTSPGFTGQTFPDAVSNIFDLVWHFEVMNGDVYRAKTIGSDALVAKTRFGGIFNEYERNVNWLDVIKRIREQIPAKRK